VKCDDWASADFESKHWGVIFIDHSPHQRRGIELVRLKDHADFIVVHDTEPRQEKRYHVAEGLASFKYRSDDIRVVPHTTVVSNFRPEAASLALP
jgi:hypothetical protein